MRSKLLIAAALLMFLVSGSAAADTAPSLSDNTPSDGANGVVKETNISVNYSDPEADDGTVTFYNSDGVKLGTRYNITNGTETGIDLALSYGETVKWYAEASDGNSSTNNYTTSTFNFKVEEQLYILRDEVIDTNYTGKAFTAKTFNQLEADIDLDSNESLTAVLKGYNSTALTENRSYSLSNGVNTLAIDSFPTNTSTYVLKLKPENGSVSINHLRVTGTTGGNSVSAAAPGLMTGGFSGAISDLTGIATNFFAGIGNAVSQTVLGIVDAVMFW
ncbi:MAG: hypothetical protein ABEJ98_03345 [Candidatus Nanohaloarchaea archaeon]